MEKIKLDFTNVEEEIVEVFGKNGDKVLVKKHIPYAEKEAQAYELAAGRLVVDEDAAACYETYKENLLATFLVVKYYTNIEISETPEEEDYRQVFDYLLANGLDREITKVIDSDFYEHVHPMAWKLTEAAMTVYEKKNSLSHKVNEMFGFLFTGGDLSEQIASAGELNDKMIDMFKALQERDANSALLKNGKAKVHSGGAVLNMAKK